MMTSDAKGTLQKLAAIGFKEVESAGSQKGNYYGFTPKEFAAMVTDAGMHWRSAHVGGAPFNTGQIMKMAKTAEDSARIKKMAEEFKKRPKTANLTEDYQQLADEAAQGGLSYLVCASIPVSTIDEINKAVEVFSKAGEACKKNGVQFAYHNHATEWKNVEGKTAYEVIMSQTDKDLVKMELDLGWVATAKKNPVELFKGNPGRFPLWHVKDFDLASEKIVPIGKGTIDFKPAFENADLAGMKYFFYEQDGAKSMEDVQTSFTNLSKISQQYLSSVVK
jgi:sugar phosphate isomerase/epimerase